MSWTTEDKFILKLLFAPEKVKAILSGKWFGTEADEKNPDWSVLLEKARREGVSAVIFHNLRRQGLADQIPTEILSALSQDYHANLKRNLSIIGALRVVLSAFQKSTVSCIVLKGIYLAECIYPNIAMRGMSDVDLLVRKEDLRKADACLSSLGYAPRDSTVALAMHNPAGYLTSLEYRRDPPSPLNLHLHWHLVNTSVPATAFIRGIDLDRIWERAACISLADSTALALCPEHLIVYLCEHALRVGHSFDRLILICDLFFTVKALEDTIDWNGLVEESRRTGLSRFAYHGLSIAKVYTGLDIPETFLKKLKPLNLSWSERLFFQLQRRNRRIRGNSYFIYLALNRGLFAKAGFLFRTFFPPRQILRQRRQVQHSEPAGSNSFSRVREVCSQALKLTSDDPGRMSSK